MKMSRKYVPVTERPLSAWVLSGNLRLQFLLIIIITITVFARVLPLEMQKKIINESIFLRKTDLLLTYSGIYLGAVLAATGLKYLINILQALIGQRALAGMRKELYHHILTLPLSFYRKTQPGMAVSALVTEIAAAGDFAGMAIAVPVTNILTLLAFGGYLFWLNPVLGAVSLSIYPLVLFLIPRLQKRANSANKKRVDITRKLSDKISESVIGIHEIHSNGTYRIENRKYDALVDRLMKIRIIWTLYRYGVKVTNNFFNNLSPFLIFILGGYLTIRGKLELGALVAFLSAQEKLYDPWKELLEFYQTYQDAVVRYQRTMEYFDVRPRHLLEPSDRLPYELDGAVEVKDLCFSTESDIRLLDHVSFSLRPGEHLAVVGFSGSGKSTLAQCIAQLYAYADGHVRIGGKEVADLTKKDMAYNMGLVSQAPFIFSGTIEENLLYSCSALMEPEDEGRFIRPTLDDMIAALQQAGIFTDVLRFGLNMVLNQEQDADLIARVIRVRENFQHDFGEILADYVEFFDRDHYLYHSGIADNIVFGTTGFEEFSDKNLPRNPYFLEFLDEADLTRPLLSLGVELSRQTVDILGSLPPDAVFFEQSPLEPEELEDYKRLVARLEKTRLHRLSDRDRQMLLDVALRFAPGRHKMVALPGILESLILEGRALFGDKISADRPGAFAFYDPSQYIGSRTLLNNILFGRMKTGNPQAREKVNQSIIRLIIEEDLLESVLRIGMQFQVGSKGDKLSGGQRQKLAIARVFLKSPKILIMDEATSALDNNSQARIQNLLEQQWRGRKTIISVAHRLDIVRNYDRVAVMKAGKIVEMGTYDELIDRKGVLYELVHGKR